jgi:hypothetical protein
MVAVADTTELPCVGHRHDAACIVVLQAWFPAHAEVWNAPTWFLSALTFAMLVLPHVLPAIAAMRKKGLKLLLVSLSSRLRKHHVAAGLSKPLLGCCPVHAHYHTCLMCLSGRVILRSHAGQASLILFVRL